MTGGLVIVCHFVRQSIAVLFEKFAAISFQRGAAKIEKMDFKMSVHVNVNLMLLTLEHNFRQLTIFVVLYKFFQ